MLYKVSKLYYKVIQIFLHNNDMSNKTKEAIAIVWFKYELRINNQAPLTMAANLQNQGIKVLPLLIIETD